jgi:hypothetical protein
MKGRRRSQGSQIFIPRNSLLDAPAVDKEDDNVDSGIVAMLKTMLNPSF